MAQDLRVMLPGVFCCPLGTQGKKKRKLLDGILQKSSTRDGEGEVWDGVTPVS